MAQNDRNKIAQKVCKRRFLFWPRKNQKWPKNFIFNKNDQKLKFLKIFGQKFFSESIQNILKRILKRKSRNRKFFPCKIFFVGLSRFSAKMAKIAKKWQR